jgi:hypothetical protein
MNETPTFLDFEASSLSDRSYPIEVAWNLADGSIEAHLISAEGIESWTDWNPESERIHGISRQQLTLEGRSPVEVRDRINESLAGKTVYTDAPQFDGMWLSRLFEACGDIKPAFQLKHMDDLLVSIVCPQIAGRTVGLVKIGVIKQEARRLSPRQHRAAWDVEYLMQTWRLAANEMKGR